MELVRDERELAGVCAALGAEDVAGWTAGEAALVATARPVERHRLEAIRVAMRDGHDPLGDAFCALRPAAQRRPMGATYTPPAIIAAMVAWARGEVAPARIVDPGTGSGRFLVAAGRAFPHATLLGVEIDPLAAATARASLAVAGLAGRSSVIVADYREIVLDHEVGPTLFIGNPPYVRHHGIEPRWKRWLAETASSRGLQASRLAGLHLHFLLATAVHARAGDAGTLITAAEWLDVNYGQLARELVCGPLGGLRIDIIEPDAQAFADAQATAAITCFRVGARPASLELRRVGAIDALAPLRGGHRVSRQRLAADSRWSPLSRGADPGESRSAGAAQPGQHGPWPDEPPDHLVELGELCRVHRGQVTGANQIWIAAAATPRLPPSVLFPAVTRARELFAAGRELVADTGLRRVIDLPSDLERLSPADREAVERFLAWAQERGAHAGYIAQHRSPWWSVRLREPAPILATYMARRPPAFVRNRVRARFLNIAHGLYPRVPLADECLDVLAAYLSSSVRLGQGRTYAGGLTKFEPREMERLLVPAPDALARRAAARRCQPA